MLAGGQTDLNTALAAVNEAQTSDVALLPVYSDIFSYTNKGNREDMMVVRFQLNEGLNNYWQTMYISNLSNVSAATLAVVGVQGVGNTGVNTAQIRRFVISSPRTTSAAWAHSMRSMITATSMSHLLC